MLPHLKQLGIQSLIYGTGHVLSRFIAFLLLPFLTHHLTPDEYSAYTQLYIAITLGMAVLILGLDIGLLRFYVPEKELSRRQGVFSSVFWSSLVVVGLGCGLAWGYARDLAAWIVTLDPIPPWGVTSFGLAVGIMGLDILSAYPLVVLRAEEKAWRFIGVNLLSGVLQLGLTLWWVVGKKMGVVGAFQANLVASVVRMAVLLPVVIGRLRWEWSGELFRRTLTFGLPNVPNFIFVSLVEMADRWLLGHIRGAYENGLYAASYRLGMFLSVVAMGFRYAWQPFFLNVADRPDARDLYSRVLTYYLVIVLGLYVALVAWVEPLVKIPFPGIGEIIAPEFHPGLRVFPVILLAHIFNGVYAIFMVGIYLERKTAVLPLISGWAALVNIVGNLLLMPKWGMWDAAWMTVLSWGLMALLLYLYIQPRYFVPYEWARLAKIIGIAAVCVALTLILRQWGETPLALLVPLLYVPLILSPWVFFKGEREVLWQMVKKVVKPAQGKVRCREKV
ncbi:MAG: lipopolysaccharide biosynthesis protein [bacterium]